MKKNVLTLFSLLLIVAFGLVACGGAPAAQEEATTFVTWYQYDEKNEDPASDERVGNEYLRKTMPEFNADFEGKWVWVNEHKAWDRMTAEIVSAVIAGADVPDLFEGSSEHTVIFYKNGTMQDLNAWAQQQPWYADLDPGAKAACTAPDGSLLCIPMVSRPHLTYVWADHWPNGYPTTPEKFLEEAERLKGEGIYAWSYFGSTAFGGSSATRMYWALISSFGGTYYALDGSMLLNTPENVAALEFLRTTVELGYNPETVWAGGFVEEDSFKDASAAAFPTGLFGYRYINPLTAPDGTKFEKGNEQDMLDAIAAGKVILRPMFAPEGKTPGCNNNLVTFSVPVGAKNPEAAYDYINWLFEDQDRYIEYVLGPGAGFPTLKSAQSAPAIQSDPFFVQASMAINASVCRPHFGTLDRPNEANELIANVIYRLVKEDPSLDIATELQKTQDEYNAGN
jgi:multiple sugar transport system substrate-binding protein